MLITPCSWGSPMIYILFIPYVLVHFSVSLTLLHHLNTKVALLFASFTSHLFSTDFGRKGPHILPAHSTRDPRRVQNTNQSTCPPCARCRGSSTRCRGSSTRCRGPLPGIIKQVAADHLHVAGGRCRGSSSRDLLVRGEEKKREPPVKLGRTSLRVAQSGGGLLHVSCNQSSRSLWREWKQKEEGAACNLATALQSSKGREQRRGEGYVTRKNEEQSSRGEQRSRRERKQRREAAAEWFWISIWNSGPLHHPQARPRDNGVDERQSASVSSLPCLLPASSSVLDSRGDLVKSIATLPCLNSSLSVSFAFCLTQCLNEL